MAPTYFRTWKSMPSYRKVRMKTKNLKYAYNTQNTTYKMENTIAGPWVPRLENGDSRLKSLS